MQWIKVFTDIFANPKIKILLKERDGDTFFRVWIQLLTIAGQCMQEGKLMISENNPMTVHELATIIHKTDAKMENILNKLIHLEMLIYQENTYIIKNWYKYQSIDKYEKILEQNRARQKNLEIRKKKKVKLHKRQLNSTFENYKITNKNKKAYENVKKYVEKLIKGTTNKGLFTTGAYGVGKTYLASCIANEIIKNGKSVIFGTLIQLLDFIRDSYSDSEVSDKDYLNLYSSVDLLVIDDLGKEKPIEWVLEKLFLIVNNRYNNYLPIVITINYNRNQLRERLCINKNYSIVDSIISRLYEMCGGIEIKDDDHRMSDSLIRESL